MTGIVCTGIFAAVFLLIAAIIVRHNLRVRRVRKAYGALPESAKQQVLDLIRRAAARQNSVTYLRLDREHAIKRGDVLLDSHVGGIPYAEQGDQWPDSPSGEEPARFLIQVRLDEPTLGPVWQGRLVQVFLVFDLEQVVRSYASPAMHKYLELSPPHEPFECIRLSHVAFPAEAADESLLPVSPARLLELAPGIAQILAPYSGDADGLLTQILQPNTYGYDLDAPDIAYIGGDPMLIQNPHDPLCGHCRKAMRFLFEFGEIIPGEQLADAGVVYVYGCDDHPDHCQAFLDSH
jgi:hypothetical protein